MLGTLAGISLTFISMRPAAQMWEVAWIGLPVLGIILIGFFTDVRLPGNIPVGLAALLVGTAIGWIGGYMSVPDVSCRRKDIAIALPNLHIDMLLDGLGDLAPLLATAIPLGVYNFTEAMSNVESAAAAGDSYNLRSVLLADGTGAIVGSALGSPFPPAVYIGHPGWKDAGGRAGYSMASGVTHRGAVLPRTVRAAGGAAAAARDRPDPAVHRAADRGAGVPGDAADPRGRGRRGDPAEPRLVGHRASSTTRWPRPAPVPRGRRRGPGQRRRGLQRAEDPRARARSSPGMVLGAIVAFIMMRKFVGAAIAAGLGAVLSWIGLIHASEVAWAAQPSVALGYAMLAVVLLAFAYRNRSESVVLEEDDPADLADPVVADA